MHSRPVNVPKTYEQKEYEWLGYFYIYLFILTIKKYFMMR